jgi:two-component system, cell cycle response regulator DivK
LFQAFGALQEVNKAMPLVLLVEDNEANRDMLSRRLTRRDWTVSMATDGRQGVEMAAFAQPDLILMDMSLPEISGWEATRMLKSMERTREIPVIALTAHAMPSDLEKALEAGCDEFETKPVDFNRLLAKMAAFMERRKPHVVCR